MHVDVASEVGFAVEAAAAVVAVVPPLLVAAVQDDVLGQARATSEASVAVGAGVGLLSGVDPLVHRHVILLEELHAAELAGELLFPGVDLLVLPETPCSFEAQVTLVALEGPLAPVGGHVGCEGPGLPETPPTLLARKGLLARVDPHVLSHGGFIREGFAAVSTLIWLFS